MKIQSTAVQKIKNSPVFLGLGGRTGNFWDSDVFLHILFLDDHNFINNHPPDLK
jgi:hypothetical protein